jgi:rSAM/selenodomain-associated transferase 1
VFHFKKKTIEETGVMSGSLAVFAKTNSISPVKTRIAADIGISLAESFYTLSVEAVAEIVRTVQKKSHNDFVPYWALAEKEALHSQEWKGFDTLWTGEGDLGTRLNTIYSSLRQKHNYVILIGTDSPQLEPELIVSAIKKLVEYPESCVIGPAFDGGFYLFGAKTPVAESVWNNVTYSQNNTLEQLSSNLLRQGITMQLLSLQGDVDTVNDLKSLMYALKVNNKLLPSQQKLYNWLQRHTEIFN